MKEYVKPELYYESFELSQHIAGCYLTIVSYKTIEECKAEMPGTGSYVFAGSQCTVQVTDPENYCYTNGSGTYNTFLS